MIQQKLNPLTSATTIVINPMTMGRQANMMAVMDNPYMLRFVKQTEEICLASVEQDGSMLEYVDEQTDKICLAAVKENVYAIQ